MPTLGELALTWLERLTKDEKQAILDAGNADAFYERIDESADFGHLIDHMVEAVYDCVLAESQVGEGKGETDGRGLESRAARSRPGASS